MILLIGVLQKNSAKNACLFMWLCLSIVAVAGCAGGIPSVPDSPEENLEKADFYFNKGKYFQAQGLYQTFLARHPGHERSDYAQFQLAETYFNDEDYALASVEYRILVTNYGYSDYVDDGYLREALCLYRQSPKPQLDQTLGYEALSKLERFVQVFPSSPLMPEAQEYIHEIKSKLAKKEFENAMFYYRNRRLSSALIYFNKIISSYSGNDYWVNSLFYKGEIMRRRAEFDEAKTFYRQVLAYPVDVPIKAQAKLALESLGDN